MAHLLESTWIPVFAAEHCPRALRRNVVTGLMFLNNNSSKESVHHELQRLSHLFGKQNSKILVV